MTTGFQTNDKGLKTRRLFLGLLFDGIGMLSFTISMLGEFSDVVWAPIAGYIMTRMYKGNIGKIAAGVGFLEELIPFTDSIPTFTVMWFYTYYIKKQK